MALLNGFKETEEIKMKEKEDAQYQKMTQTPIYKLIPTLAVPTIISMLATALYNMADTYFV